MRIPPRPLFLAALLLAAACSDAGSPVAPREGDTTRPVAAPEDVLTVLTCTVDVRAGTEVCAPEQPGTGDALGGLVVLGTIFFRRDRHVRTPAALARRRLIASLFWRVHRARLAPKLA